MAQDGRVALVSGANRGIEREVVRQLAEKGISVILSSRSEQKGLKAAEGIDGDIHARRLDVTDEKGTQRLAREVEEEFGRLDILVDNAGIAIHRGQCGVDADLGVVRETLEMNLSGVWRLCQASVPLMRRNGYGRIANAFSGMGTLNEMGSGSPAYRVSKTALNMLASELRGCGILVNSVCPGPTAPTRVARAPLAPSRRGLTCW